MADIKNFGLVGVGSNIQLGKGGNRLVSENGQIAVRDAAGVLTNLSANRLQLLSAAGLPTDPGVAGLVRAVAVAGVTQIEFYDGSKWVVIATGNDSSSLASDITKIEEALGAMYADGFVGQTLATANPGIWATAPADLTKAITTLAAYASSIELGDLVAGTAGQVLYHNGTEWVAGSTGSASGVQAHSAKLDALVAHPDAGILVQLADGTFASRAILGADGEVTVTGDVKTGDLTIGLADVMPTESGSFLKVTIDSKGRVVGKSNVVATDISALVDDRYVKLAGDTMAGDLSFGNTYRVTGLADPILATDAATKGYVDSALAGLSWKDAVVVKASAPIMLSGLQAIDGYTVAEGDRVLVSGQADTAKNGIYVASADAWVRSADASDFAALAGAAVFVQRGANYADTGWTQNTELTGFTGQSWVQFTGAGAFQAGAGMSLDGITFSVNMGAGIKVLPTDEVGLDIVPNQAIQLTNENTDGQLALVLTATGGLQQSAAGLELKLNAAGGLKSTADGLAIKAAGVTNAMLENSKVVISNGTGTLDVDLGETFTVTATGALTSTLTATGVELSVAAATATTLGVASFDATQFTVTDGAVRLNSVSVSDGGTGRTSFTPGAILVGNGSDGIIEYTGFEYDHTTDIMSIGEVTVDGADSIILGTSGLVLGATAGDVTFTVKDGGMLKIVDTVAATYAAQVTDGNHIPNKTYVDQTVAAAIDNLSQNAMHVVNSGMQTIDASGTLVSNVPNNVRFTRAVVKVRTAGANGTFVAKTTSNVVLFDESDVDFSEVGTYVIDLDEVSAVNAVSYTGTATGVIEVTFHYYGAKPL